MSGSTPTLSQHPYGIFLSPYSAYNTPNTSTLASIPPTTNAAMGTPANPPQALMVDPLYASNFGVGFPMGFSATSDGTKAPTNTGIYMSANGLGVSSSSNSIGVISPQPLVTPSTSVQGLSRENGTPVTSGDGIPYAVLSTVSVPSLSSVQSSSVSEKPMPKFKDASVSTENSMFSSDKGFSLPLQNSEGVNQKSSSSEQRTSGTITHSMAKDAESFHPVTEGKNKWTNKTITFLDITKSSHTRHPVRNSTGS